MVKGLDYALLHQERQKLEQDTADAAAAAKAAAMLPRGLHPDQMQFETRQGRAVFDAMFKAPPDTRALVREMFQPQRTAFVFEFAEGSSDVPTTLRRSKADCPPPQVGHCRQCLGVGWGVLWHGVAAASVVEAGGDHFMVAS